jgi:hypothetical protein
MDRRGKEGYLADYLTNLLLKAADSDFLEDVTVGGSAVFKGQELRLLQFLLLQSIPIEWNGKGYESCPKCFKI